MAPSCLACQAASNDILVAAPLPAVARDTSAASPAMTAVVGVGVRATQRCRCRSSSFCEHHSHIYSLGPFVTVNIIIGPIALASGYSSIQSNHNRHHLTRIVITL